MVEAIECESIQKSFLPIPFVNLNSDLARSMKEDSEDMLKFKQRANRTPAVLDPAPEVRVAEVVKAANQDPLIFPAVVRELTLKQIVFTMEFHETF